MLSRCLSDITWGEPTHIEPLAPGPSTEADVQHDVSKLQAAWLTILRRRSQFASSGIAPVGASYWRVKIFLQAPSWSETCRLRSHQRTPSSAAAARLA